jgi:hypothetical protein
VPFRPFSEALLSHFRRLIASDQLATEERPHCRSTTPIRR